ncbi:MAG: tetratricopeptide repeat protein [Sterolibacterium sp.]
MSTGSHQEPAENGPSALEANTLIGLTSEGRRTEAATLAHRLIERFPLHEFGWKVLGAVLKQMGRSAEALLPMQNSLALMPGDPEAHSNLGNALQDIGRLNDAVICYRRALQIKPELAEAHYNQADALNNLGRLDDAIAAYGRAQQAKPDFAAAHANLAVALYHLGRLNETVTSCRRALAIKSDLVEAHDNLGAALHDLGRLDDAVARHRRALAIRPDFGAAHDNLGNVLRALGRYVDALTSHRRALAIKPEFAEAHGNLGNTQNDMGRVEGAVASYRRALAIKPDYAEAHNNLANAYKTLGRYADALASHHRALAINPDFPVAHSNLIFTIDMSPGIDLAAMHQERRRWDEIHAAPLAATHRPHPNPPDPERRLRIGYVSADFREHSAAYAFGAMLTQFDPARFEVFAYSNTTREDTLSRRLQQGVSGWRPIVGQSDEAVAALIRQDRIDILVDLSGHSAGNRLLVFARKPAPLQVTAWGYATGTGLQAMDAFFADAVVVPPEDRQHFTEEVRYLPCVVPWSFPPQAFPEVNPLPALTAPGITFGSLNRLAKVSAQAIDTWSRVLLATPGSRMLLKTGEFDDAGTRARVMQAFTEAGVDPARIVLMGKTSWHDHVGAFGRVDIALDPYPHGGGVTTLEGLMMGVPVVTLRWPTVVGRLSASILTTLGLTDWIAETPDAYVSLARQKAEDLVALADLRQRLRPLFGASVIGDPAAYVVAVEQEYRTLWRRWCTRDQSRPPTVTGGRMPDSNR